MFEDIEWSVTPLCKDCGEVVPVGRDYCINCEFDILTPPAWSELFLVALQNWKEEKAS